MLEMVVVIQPVRSGALQQGSYASQISCHYTNVNASNTGKRHREECEHTSELSRRPDQGGVVLHDRSGIVGHIFDNLLGGEDFVYLSSDTTSEPWSCTKKFFGVFLEIVFDREDTLIKEGLGLSLAVVLPDKKK